MASRLMTAICLDKTGRPKALKKREVNIPVIEDDKVLIKDAAVSVNHYKIGCSKYISSRHGGEEKSTYIGSELIFPNLMRAICFDKVGGPEVLKERVVEIPVIKDDEVLIKVAAVGVNHYDTALRGLIGVDRRRVTSPYIGLECSGEVIAIGANVQNRKVGDKVCAFLYNNGGYAEFVNVPEMFTLLVPKGISLIDAASLPHNTSIVWQFLSMTHKTRRGQKILIHGAGGGIGTIAIQYAKHLGCDVFVTAGNEKKLQICEVLGAKVCINYKKEDFCRRVKAETNGKGVDIIVDVVGKEWLAKNLDCLAFGGSLITVGAITGGAVNLDFSVVRKENFSICGASLFGYSKERLQFILNNVEKDIWPLIASGAMTPVVGKVYKFLEAAKAHEALQKFTFPGKILLVP